MYSLFEKHEKEVALADGKFLLLDGLQDPGNLGTIIRTADAAGIHAVVLGEGCVDVYNSKVLRSTQGSIFHLPIVKGNLEEWVDKLKKITFLYMEQLLKMEFRTGSNTSW